MTDKERDDLVKELARRSELLSKLLKDPQWGIATWVMAVREEAQFISDWWAGKFADRTKTN